MDHNENEKLKAIMEERKAEAKANMMLIDMLSIIAPDEHKPLFEMPKLAVTIVNKIGDVVGAIKEFDNIDDDARYAKEACTFLARVDEAIEAFMEQNIPSKSKESNGFDHMWEVEK